jgi:hypothetical protein
MITRRLLEDGGAALGAGTAATGAGLGADAGVEEEGEDLAAAAGELMAGLSLLSN